ncbi:MAG: winged helix-turn-helix transcriptional regulator [Nanoarchaeota archaeon]|nr:winged helix-turn-helix transcriptional regulator [Nanoarchaeota archaeon]
MELENIFSDSKWEMMAYLSHESLSPSELAEKTGTSPANISTQLKLLEALDFIEQEKLHSSAKGKPRKKYHLKKQFAYMMVCSKSLAGKKLVKLDSQATPFFSVWLACEPSLAMALLKFFLVNESLSKEFKAVSLVSGRNEEVELFVVHEAPQSFRHEFTVDCNEKHYAIKLLAHTMEEVETGVVSKNEHFLGILRKSFVLSDKDGIMTRLKKGGK